MYTIECANCGRKDRINDRLKDKTLRCEDCTDVIQGSIDIKKEIEDKKIDIPDWIPICIIAGICSFFPITYHYMPTTFYAIADKIASWENSIFPPEPEIAKLNIAKPNIDRKNQDFKIAAKMHIDETIDNDATVSYKEASERWVKQFISKEGNNLHFGSGETYKNHIGNTIVKSWVGFDDWNGNYQNYKYTCTISHRRGKKRCTYLFIDELGGCLVKDEIISGYVGDKITRDDEYRQLPEEYWQLIRKQCDQERLIAEKEKELRLEQYQQVQEKQQKRKEYIKNRELFIKEVMWNKGYSRIKAERYFNAVETKNKK